MERENIENFIIENQNLFLKFLKSSYSDFPMCCDRSIYILGSYLKIKFPKYKIKLCGGEFKKAYHCWLLINDNILIDSVRIQFKIDQKIIFYYNNKEDKNSINDYKLMYIYEFDDKLLDKASNSKSFIEYLTLCKNYKGE